MEKTTSSIRIISEIYRNINKTWNRLIEPSSTLIDSEDQRKSRLISSLILIAIIIFLVYIVSFLLFDAYVLRTEFTGEVFLYVISDSISLIILIITLFVSKTKYYNTSSLIFLITCIGILIFNILVEDEIIFQIIFILALFTFLIIFTSLMYSTRTLVVGFFVYLMLFLIITTIVKPQDGNVILLLASVFTFQFLLTIVQNHHYYRRVAELEVAITEKKFAKDHSDFLNSLLTHDMANKITRVNGYLYLMSKTELESEKENYLERTVATCKEGTDLINKINHLRDIEESTDLANQKVNLSSVLAQVVNLYQDHASTNGIKIILNEQEEDISVSGGELLKELFSNLIENSIHHSSGSLLKISLNKSPKIISVTIEDNGVGIPETVSKNLFKRGIKGEKSKGSGIGLFLVKSIAENLNVNILVGESSLGGAKFVLEFKQFKAL